MEKLKLYIFVFIVIFNKNLKADPSSSSNVDCSAIAESQNDPDKLYSQVKKALKQNIAFQTIFKNQKSEIHNDIIDHCRKVENQSLVPKFIDSLDEKLNHFMSLCDSFINDKNISQNPSQQDMKIQSMKQDLNDFIQLLQTLMKIYEPQAQAFKKARENCNQSSSSLDSHSQK